MSETTTPADYIRTHDTRARHLWRMPQAALAAACREAHPGIWTAEPLATWSEDELANGILDAEFPAIAQARAAYYAGTPS